MKKILLLLAICLIAPSFSLQAQTSKKNKKEVSPFIEGKHKVRQLDYDSVWKFVTFDAKHIYFCDFDYRKIDSLSTVRHPNWESFQPVINYLTTVSRSPMRICAIFAVNPDIKDADLRAMLEEKGREEALESLQIFQDWATAEEMRNKMQLNVAQVDYRYWKGSEYFTMEETLPDLIQVGFVLYFGTKKVNLFPSAAEGAKTFNNVKFFPNDATIVDSYNSLLDDLAKYLKENDRFEVLLTGYSDNVGTSAYNLGVSRQRAVEIKKALIRRGVPEYRIEVEAKGEADPLGDNNTYEGRIANNRVSITIQ